MAFYHNGNLLSSAKRAVSSVLNCIVPKKCDYKNGQPLFAAKIMEITNNQNEDYLITMLCFDIKMCRHIVVIHSDSLDWIDFIHSDPNMRDKDSTINLASMLKIYDEICRTEIKYGTWINMGCEKTYWVRGYLDYSIKRRGFMSNIEMLNEIIMGNKFLATKNINYFGKVKVAGIPLFEWFTLDNTFRGTLNGYAKTYTNNFNICKNDLQMCKNISSCQTCHSDLDQCNLDVFGAERRCDAVSLVGVSETQKEKYYRDVKLSLCQSQNRCEGCWFHVSRGIEKYNDMMSYYQKLAPHLNPNKPLESFYKKKTHKEMYDYTNKFMPILQIVIDKNGCKSEGNPFLTGSIKIMYYQFISVCKFNTKHEKYIIKMIFVMYVQVCMNSIGFCLDNSKLHSIFKKRKKRIPIR